MVELLSGVAFLVVDHDACLYSPREASTTIHMYLYGYFMDVGKTEMSANVVQHREEVNVVLEMARREGFIGASLEAKVLLHVADPQLASQLQLLQGVSLIHSHPSIQPLPALRVSKCAGILSTKGSSRVCDQFVG